MVKKGMVQMKFLYVSQEGSFGGHVQLAVMASIDDLVIAGKAHMVKSSLQ